MSRKTILALTGVGLLTVGLLGYIADVPTTYQSFLRERRAKYNPDGLNDPDGVWMLTYTNSGADQLANDIMDITGKAVATNYGNVMQEYDGRLARNMHQSIPIWPNRPNGPFLLRRMKRPANFIPVITHCGSYCIDCHPQFYLQTQYQFASDCRATMKYTPAEGGGGTLEKTKYDPLLMKKAIKLIRPPIDTVVSRFRQQARAGNRPWNERFPDTKEGFHQWCQSVDSRFEDEKDEKWPALVRQMSRDVPCHTEFFRYIRWQNMAHKVMTDQFLGIPVVVLHTEDFKENYLEEMGWLLNFLQIEVDESKLVRFASHKVFNLDEFSDYFTDDERSKIACYMKVMADQNTFRHLERYFNDCNEEQS